MRTNGCPACSHTYADEHEVSGVVVCRRCGAVYTTRAIYRGESYKIVRPYWHIGPEDPENASYFDLDVLGSEGLERRHGWFDRASKRITQVG